MARIAGINIPVQKHTVIALTSIYGIGHTRARAICAAAHVDPHIKVKSLTEAQVEPLATEVAKTAIDLELRHFGTQRFDPGLGQARDLDMRINMRCRTNGPRTGMSDAVD